MIKNTSGQKIAYYAHDTSADAPKTGDAANITAYVSKDAAAPAALGDTSAAELDATNAKGVYVFDLTQAETNADMLVFSAKSSTANVQLDPMIVFPQDATISSRASQASVDTVDDFLDTEITDIRNRLPAALVSGRIDASVGAMAADTMTASALATDAVDEFWEYATASIGTAGGIGKLLKDNLDATVSSRATPAQVNSEADTALADVGLTTTITGRIDAAVSTRATPAQVNTEADAALADVGLTTTVTGRIDVAVSSVSGGGGLTQADVRTAVGLASANLDTQLGTISTRVILALPNAAPGQSDGVITQGSQAGQINCNGGRADANVLYWNGSAVIIPDVAGAPKVDVNRWRGSVPNVLISGRVDATATLGDVTVGGYATGQDPATLVLDVLASAHNTANTVGAKISSAGAAGDPWSVILADGSYVFGSAAWHVMQIGTGQITVVSPVATNGDFEIFKGDDYAVALGNPIPWTNTIVDGLGWPTLDGTVTFRARRNINGPVILTKTVTKITTTGNTKEIALELTAAETGASTLPRGKYLFEVVHVSLASKTRTLVEGVMTVKGD